MIMEEFGKREIERPDKEIWKREIEGPYKEICDQLQVSSKTIQIWAFSVKVENSPQ